MATNESNSQAYPVQPQVAYLNTRAELPEARELGEYLMNQARRDNDPAKLLMAYRGLCPTLSYQGELTLAQQHFAQSIEWPRCLAGNGGRGRQTSLAGDAD